MATATAPAPTANAATTQATAAAAKAQATQPGSRLFPTRHDLPAETRQRMVALLNQQLADMTDLRTQIKHAHWNIKGRNFIGLHKLLDEQAERVDTFADLIAERAVLMGGLAVGPVKAVARLTRLPEFPEDVVDIREVEVVIADRFAAVAKTTRAAIDTADDAGDKDTADLFTEVSRALDRDLWFIEAHIQSEG